MEDDMNVGYIMEMPPSKNNEISMAVDVDTSSRSLLKRNDGKERNELVGDHLVLNEKSIKISVENNDRDERFDKDGQYPKRKQRPPRKW